MCNAPLRHCTEGWVMSEVKAALKYANFDRNLDPIRVEDLALEQIEIYTTNKRDKICVVAEEKGGASRFNYATVVCLSNGRKALPFKVLEHEQGWIIKFFFRPRQRFVTIRIEYGKHGLTLNAWQNVLLPGKREGEFELRRSAIVRDTSVVINEGKIPGPLRRYANALQACIDRFNCECCCHCHYGIDPAVAARKRRKSRRLD